MGNPHIERLETRRLLASGDVDATFGIEGHRADDLGSLQSADVAERLSDGKYIVAGGTLDILLADQGHYTLRRYNADGSPDTTFGANGLVSGNFTSADNDDSTISEIIPQPDGKIVVRGKAQESRLQEVLARFNADGSLDTSFSDDGVLPWPSVLAPVGWTVQGDGKILALSNASLQRLNTDGSIDTTFGSNGTASLPSDIDWASLHLLTVQSDGKILIVAGTTSLHMTRFNSDGSLDTTFGTSGVVFGPTLTGGAEKALGQLIRLPSGKFLGAGGGGGLHVARFNADGSPDTTFGDSSDGETSIPFTANTLLAKMVIDNTGNIDLIGWNGGYQLARVNSSGIFDPTFGKVVAYIANKGLVHPSNAFIQSDGNLLTVGQRNTSTGRHTFDTFVHFDSFLSADSNPDSPIELNSGVLSIDGRANAHSYVIASDIDASIFATINNFGRAFDRSAVQKLDVTTGPFGDVIDLHGISEPAHVSGGGESDKIAGGSGRDTLEGNGGTDYIDGGAGADVISGGAGPDHIQGQGSSDHLYGRDGNDAIFGGAGNDLIDGGNGVDILHGNAGDDLLISAGDNATDSVFGDDGQDRGHTDPDDLLDSIETMV